MAPSIRNDRPISALLYQALPPEIFVEMLKYLSLNELVVASHVCLPWRNIAIGTPVLWINLTNPPLAAISTMVFRARNIPVSLMATCLNQRVFPVLCASVHDHLANFRCLSITFDRRLAAIDNRVWVWPQLWQALHKPAPNLESFTLWDDNFASYLPGSGEPELFCGDAPKLRRLRLQGFEIDTPTTSFSKVTTLDASAYSLVTMRPLEDHFPELVELRIFDIPTLPCPPLHLPNLRKLVLQLYMDNGHDPIEDWRTVIAWLRESGMDSIPKITVDHQDLSVQRTVLQSAPTLSSTFSIYSRTPQYYTIGVEGEGDAWRVVGALCRRHVVQHIREAMSFCRGVTKFCTNKLDLLADLDPNFISNITTIEVPVHGRFHGSPSPHIYDVQSLPVFPNVKTWISQGINTVFFPGTSKNYEIDASSVIAFARHSFPNVEAVRIAGVHVLNVDILSNYFAHFDYHPSDDQYLHRNFGY